MGLVLLAGSLLAGPGDRFREKGIEAFRQGRYPESVAYFRRYVKVEPYSTLSHYYLGRALLLREDLRPQNDPRGRQAIYRNYREAARHIRRSLEMTGRLEVAKNEINTDLWATAHRHFHLAMAYWLGGESDRALTHFRNVIRIQFRYLEAYYNMASIYEMRGQWDKAECYFRLYLRQKYTQKVEEAELEDMDIGTQQTDPVKKLECYK